MDNKEAIEYLKWIRPIRPYSLDKIKVQESIDLAIKVLEERPQGEWVYHSDGYFAFYTCNRCNGFGNIDEKFCGHCGAEMRKGDAK